MNEKPEDRRYRIDGADRSRLWPHIDVEKLEELLGRLTDAERLSVLNALTIRTGAPHTDGFTQLRVPTLDDPESQRLLERIVAPRGIGRAPASFPPNWMRIAAPFRLAIRNPQPSASSEPHFSVMRTPTSEDLVLIIDDDSIEQSLTMAVVELLRIRADGAPPQAELLQLLQEPRMQRALAACLHAAQSGPIDLVEGIGPARVVEVWLPGSRSQRTRPVERDDIDS